MNETMPPAHNSCGTDDNVPAPDTQLTALPADKVVGVGRVFANTDSVYHLPDDSTALCGATLTRTRSAAALEEVGFGDLRPCANCLMHRGVSRSTSPEEKPCPLCGEPVEIMRYHLPCDGVDDGIRADGGTLVATFDCPECGDRHRSPDQLPFQCSNCGARVSVSDRVVGDV